MVQIPDADPGLDQAAMVEHAACCLAEIRDRLNKSRQIGEKIAIAIASAGL